MSDNFKIFLSPWTQELFDQIKKVQNELIVISPWIKATGIQLIIDALPKKDDLNIELITRLSTRDMISGISDMVAYNNLLSNFKNVNIKCVSNLHAKVYIFDRKSMILTSGNLTVGGLKNNVEAGVLITSAKDVQNFTEEIIKQISNAPTYNSETFKEISNLIHEQILQIQKDNINIPIQDTKIPQQNYELLTFGKRIIPFNSLTSEPYVLKVVPTKKINIQKVTSKKSELDIEELPKLDIKAIFKSKAPGLIKKINVFFNDKNPLSIDESIKIFIHPSLSKSYFQFNQEFKKDIWIGRKFWDLFTLNYCINNLGENYPFVKMNEISVNLYKNSQQLLEGNHISPNDLMVNPNISENEINNYFPKLPFIILGKVINKNSWNHSFELINLATTKAFPPAIFFKIERFDSKTKLMQLAQESFKKQPVYKIVFESGSDQFPAFEAEVSINGIKYGNGKGKSKQIAEMKAATMALDNVMFKQEDESNKGKNTYIGEIDSEEKAKLIKFFNKALKTKSSDLFFEKIHKSLVSREWCIKNNINESYSTQDLYASLGNKVWNLLISRAILKNKEIYASDLGEFENACQQFKYLVSSNYSLSRYYRASKGISINCFFGIVFAIAGYERVQEIFDLHITKQINSIISKANSIEMLEIIHPVSRLQSLAHSYNLPDPEYEISTHKIKGKSSTYGVSAIINDKVYGYAESNKSIKDARMSAALLAVKELRQLDTIKED